MKKSTLFSRFFRETRFGLVATGLILAINLWQPMKINATNYVTNVAGSMDGTVLANWISTDATPVVPTAFTGVGDTWTTTVPATGNMIVRIGSATPATFLGENLIIANKGLLQSVVASTTSTVNNLTLNAGGLISNANGGVFVISLNGKTFTLNGGALTCQNANRTTNFRKGSLAGSGTVDITCQSATFYGTADFSNTLAADAVTMTGFTGTFNVNAYGILKLPVITSASFKLNLQKSGAIYGRIDNTNSIAVKSLYIGCTAGGGVIETGGSFVSPGVYSYGSNSGLLNSYLTSTTSTATITVAANPQSPTAVAATPSNASALVSFTIPTWNTNTTANTTYTVTPYDAGVAVPSLIVTGATSSPVTVTGLTNGKPYTFTVTATNTWGSSVSAPSTAVTPSAVLSLTSMATSSVTTNSAVFNGNITYDGGSAITDRGFNYNTTSGVSTQNPVSIGGTGTGTFASSTVTGLIPNTHYFYKAYATNALNGTVQANEISFYTLAEVPQTPTVNNAKINTVDVAVNTGGNNPTSTQYAIQETTSAKYVQANGALGVTAVWQTATTWGTTTVISLAANTAYTFKVKARNNDATPTETAFSPTASATTNASVSFTKGNLIVSRVNDGSSVLSANWTTVFMDEYTPSGTFVQSVQLPTAVSGSNQPIGISGNVRQMEGILNLSVDKQYLLTSGYKNNAAGVPGTDGNSRIIARVDVNGTVNSATQLNELTSTVRGVVSTNGTDLWIGNGPAYTTLGATTSATTPAPAVVLSTAQYMGAINMGIYDNKLYNCGAVAQNRFGYFNNNTPTTGNQTYTTLASFDGSGGTVNNQIVNPNSFVMFDLDPTIPGVDVLYVAEDIYNGGATTDNTSKGLTKFCKNATGLWVKKGSAACPTASNGLTGLTGTYNASTGVITLYAVTESADGSGITTSTAPTSVVTITDNTGYNGTLAGTLTTKATSVLNTAFRGIAFAPQAATVPDAPAKVLATAGNAQVSVEFCTPNDKGGSVISSYTITPYIGGVAQTTITGVTASPYTYSATNGTSYTFTVTAVNSTGSGTESAPSNPVTPITVPDAPTAVTASVAGVSGTATVSFTAPASNGGSAITSYTATSSPGGITGTLNQAGSGTITVSGLTNGTAYTFTVKATNSAGASAASAATSPAVTPYTVPGPPTAVTATAGNAQVSVAFIAPANNGGTAITNYSIIPYILGVAQTPILNVTSSPFTITGLTNTTAYTFTVMANNLAGSSAESTASVAVTPDATANIISVTSDKNVSDLALTPVSDISVASGYTLTVNGVTNVNTITVAPGAKLTLGTAKLTTATNGVILQSSSTGNGTLVDNTITSPQSVSATVFQYMPQGRNWYVGSPTTSGNSSSLSTTGLAASVSYYDEPTSKWVNSYSGSLTKGIGYIAVSATGTGTNYAQFTGTLNTGSVPLTLSQKGVTYSGFNLVANPYPSYLNAMSAINNANTTAGSTAIKTTIWYRTKSTGGIYYFETVNTATGEGTNAAGSGIVTGYVPPMQAFWVQTTVDAQPLTFDNSMRYHANPTVNSTLITTTSMKVKAQNETQRIRLQVSNGMNSDEAVIYSNANASNDYDIYDSPKRSNANSAIPEIYTLAGTEQLVINGLNNFTANLEIPLGFTPGATNNFSIKASEVSNLAPDMRVILKDNQSNTEQDLTNGAAYEFSSDATASSSRFSVIFKTSSVSTSILTNTDSNNSIFIYKNQSNQIAVNIPSEIAGKACVSVFNAVGQKFESKQLNSTVSILENSYTSGIYLVSVISNGKTTTRKVVIN